MNIIQIGCHIGNDHVYDLVSSKHWDNAILIDANPYVLDTCKNRYSQVNNVQFLNYAIVPDYSNNEKFIKFYIPKQDKLSAHCSVSLDFIKKHNHKEWIEELVPCITINDLLEQIDLPKIDRLYIDAEGLDSKIILSLNLDIVEIDYIFFEHMHSDGAFSHGSNLQNAISKLQKYNYRLKDNDMYNLGFERS